MTRALLALTIAICLISATAGAAEAPTQGFDGHFREGLTFYQTKDYEKARQSFADALAIEPRNAAAMVNLGLTSFQLNDKGQAIALFRRALALEPDMKTAREGLRFAVSKLEIKEIPHRIETYETIRSNVLQLTTLRVFLALTAILILAAGWFLLSWLGERRRALRAQEAPAPFPVKVGALLTLALAGIALTVLKLYDGTLPRGTIVGGKIEARSAPAESGVVLFELHDGFEVLMREVKDGWVQVAYPGGLTGWIPVKNIVSEDVGSSL